VLDLHRLLGAGVPGLLLAGAELLDPLLHRLRLLWRHLAILPTARPLVEGILTSSLP
jgi:hypothetical protein